MACCNTSVSQTLRQTQQQLLDSVQTAVPPDMRLAQSIVSKEDVSISYELDCRKLCVGFRPDIQFRFSWGLILIRRWLGLDINYYTGALLMPTVRVVGDLWIDEWMDRWVDGTADRWVGGRMNS